MARTRTAPKTATTSSSPARKTRRRTAEPKPPTLEERVTALEETARALKHAIGLLP